MAKHAIELRRKRYFKISSQIAQLDNVQLRALLETGKPNESSTGWGMNHIIDLGPFKVFVKRVPVTNLEYKNLFSTRNLYDLPTYCHYGFGSTGFGVFRELITHIKTTHWVLAGTIATFPLMYHYRIMPCSKPHADVDMASLKEYVASWGNSANAGNYVLDREKANHELVLFLEYIPHVLGNWLRDNPDKLQPLWDDLRITLDFLKAQEIIHFDAHFKNVLTDGEQIYLTDFGLALDKSFALTKAEETFFNQNKLYDYGEVLRNLGHLIRFSYDLCSENDKHKMMKKYGLQAGLQPHELGPILLDNIEQIQADGVMKLDEFYVVSIVKYRSIIMLMQNFFADMWGNHQKDTKLQHTKLRQLLEATGFLSGADAQGG